MRPINIKISAFGPYAGNVEIPMEQLGTQGLYLITGDTGAGKTTIFDAISFALFGAPSGPTRDASMFRSKYADPDTPTEVELTFAHSGEEYTVKRNPEYMRPSKRGDKFTKQTADAELHMPDGSVITKVKPVTEAIEGLLGINKDQFSQIAMLAQGDFLKLLLAPTSDRINIFRELFKTQNYLTLQKKLEDKARELYGQVQDEKKSIDQYISGIQVDKDDVLSIEVDKAKDGLMTTEDVVELLDKLTAQDVALKDRIEDKLKDTNAELEKVNNRLGAAQALENAKNALAKAKERLLAEEPKIEELQENLDAAKEALSEKVKLEKAAAQIEAELGNYDKSDELESIIKRNRAESEKEDRKLAELIELKDKKQKELDAMKTEQESLKGAAAELEQKKAEYERIQAEIDQMKEIYDSLKAFDEMQKELKKARDVYRAKDEAFRSLNSKYEGMDQAFRDGQAGILAEKLKEGERCPVCGSTTHPQLAHLADNVPSEKELEKAKKDADSARGEREKASTEAGGLGKASENAENELKKKLKKQLDTEDIEEGREKLIETQKGLIEKRKAVINEGNEIKAKKDRHGSLDELVPDAENAIRKLSEETEQLRTSIAAFKSKLDENEKQLKELKKNLKFDSKRSANDEIRKLLENASALQQAYDKANEALSAQKEIIVKLRADIDSNEKTIEKSEAQDVSADLEAQRILKETQEECIAKGKIVTARVNTNESVRTNIIKRSGNATEVEKKLQWVKSLSDTANGKLTGKDKIMLETYIQTTYFDRIIERANLRLMTMSAGQYELVRMKEAINGKSQSGLDLGVIDHYNGSERSVKTLSGGESFIASLSLALGLSDEVQSSAGGIRIDTMFVDEGFGSLDPEALEQAYKALAGLTEGNRLVGIISHVADLKERIDKQLIVTKEKSGGSFVKLNV